jgi:uncharacterized protein involved in response to NO
VVVAEVLDLTEVQGVQGERQTVLVERLFLEAQEILIVEVRVVLQLLLLLVRHFLLVVQAALVGVVVQRDLRENPEPALLGLPLEVQGVDRVTMS